jgi:hypothetical protein
MRCHLSLVIGHWFLWVCLWGFSVVHPLSADYFSATVVPLTPLTPLHPSIPFHETVAAGNGSAPGRIVMILASCHIDYTLVSLKVETIQPAFAHSLRPLDPDVVQKLPQ